MNENIVKEPTGILPFTGDCALSGTNVVWRQKKISELKNIYKNEAALAQFDPEQLAYKVANQNYHRQDFVMGNLQWGVTYLNPYTVDGECSMTHGHFHIDPCCDEYYYGLSGEGFLLFWDGKDDFFAQKVYPGSLHYISGKYAHRIINSGDTVLAVAACSLPATKQDHAIIESRPFPYRCYKRGGKIEWVKEG